MTSLFSNPARVWLLCLVVLCTATAAWAWNWYTAGHTEWVGAATFSPDGDRLVTAAGDDHTAEIIAWDVATSGLTRRQSVDSGRPRWLWHSRSELVALGCSVFGADITDFKPNEVTLLNIDTGDVVDSYKEQLVSGGTLPLSETQRLVVYGMRSIEVRGVRDASKTALFSDSDADHNRVRCSGNEQFLVATDRNKVHVWDFGSSEKLPVLEGVELRLGEVAVSNDGNFVAASRHEDDFDADTFPLFFWDRSSGNAPVNTVSFPRAVTALHFLSGTPPRLLVVSGKDHVECEVSLFTPSGERLHKLYEGNASIESVDVTPDDRRIVWVDSQKNGEMWDVSGDEPRKVWQQSLIEAHTIQLSPDSKLVAGFGYSPDVWLFDASSGNVSARLSGYQSSELAFYLFSILPLFLMIAVMQSYRTAAAKKREDCMSNVARQLGWQHTSGALPDDISEFDFFERRRGGTFEHVLLGRGEDYHALLAVYTWIVRSGDTTTPMEDLCVIYPLVSDQLPDLFIRPEFLTDKLAEYAGFTDIDLNDTEILSRFSSQYLLRTNAPEKMPSVISESLAQFLCEHPGWNIEVRDGSVLLRWQRVESFTTSRFPISEPAGVLAFYHESSQILRRLVPEIAPDKE